MEQFPPLNDRTALGGHLSSLTQAGKTIFEQLESSTKTSLKGFSISLFRLGAKLKPTWPRGLTVMFLAAPRQLYKFHCRPAFWLVCPAPLPSWPNWYHQLNCKAIQEMCEPWDMWSEWRQTNQPINQPVVGRPTYLGEEGEQAVQESVTWCCYFVFSFSFCWLLQFAKGKNSKALWILLIITQPLVWYFGQEL